MRTRCASMARARRSPTIAKNGTTLTFALPQVAAATTVEVEYVTEISAGAEIGKAVNAAHVIGVGVGSSNTASATVTVREDLFATKAILIGQVIDGDCADGRTKGLGWRARAARRRHLRGHGRRRQVPHRRRRAGYPRRAARRRHAAGNARSDQLRQRHAPRRHRVLAIRRRSGRHDVARRFPRCEEAAVVESGDAAHSTRRCDDSIAARETSR